MSDRYNFDRDRERERNWEEDRERRERQNWQERRGDPAYSGYGRETGRGENRDWDRERAGEWSRRGGREEWSRGPDWGRERWQHEPENRRERYDEGRNWGREERSGEPNRGQWEWSGEGREHDWEREHRGGGQWLPRGERGMSGDWFADRGGYSGQDLFGTGSRGFGTTWGGSNRYAGGMGTYSGGMGAYGERGYTGRGPKGYQRADDRIREDVCERLTADPQVDASEIEVRVSNGEVTLTGLVDRREEKRMAEDLAEGISGVRDVHNQLRVQQQQGTQPQQMAGHTKETTAKK